MATFPTVAPIDEIRVIANEDAIVTRVGIFNITNMIGTRRNAPPAPTIPSPIPTIKTKDDANHLLK